MSNHFADKVIAQIEREGMEIANGFMTGDYFVNKDREMIGRHWACSAETLDEWNLCPGWIWVDLRRGPECIEIKLTREQNRILRDHCKRWYRLKKLENQAREKAKKERALLAQKA